MTCSNSTRERGRLGEALAARYLEATGCRVLARNWRTGRLEIDLVIRDGTTVAFVEVKTRRPGPQLPAEAVDWRKRRRIRRAAAQWIAANGRPGEDYRFDVVAIALCGGGRARIGHVRQAFTGDDG